MPVTMDTQQQNFWLESIKKEAAVRFTWQLRYSKNFSKTAAASAHQKQEEQQKKQPVAGTAASNSFRSDLSAQIRKLKQEETRETDRPSTVACTTSRRSSAAKEAIIIADMRPPSVKTKALLYNGISAHEEGRYAYLKKRSHIVPELKYEYPVLSSSLHGWKIMEYTSEPQQSPYGRSCIIRDTFYRNSGITLT